MDTIEALAGTVPDGEVAARLGMDVEAVKEWRREHDVAPFRRPPPARLVADAPKRPQVIRRRGDTVEAVAWREEPTPEEAAPTEVVAVERPRKRAGRPSAEARLQPLRDRLGKEPDDVIARAAGVSRGVVGAWRRKHGIAAYEGYLFRPGHPAAARPARPRRPVSEVPAPAPAPAPAPVRRTERLRAWCVLATARGTQREFTVVGPDLGEACGRAEGALRARSDGPWLVDAVRFLGDAVG